MSIEPKLLRIDNCIYNINAIAYIGLNYIEDSPKYIVKLINDPIHIPLTESEYKVFLRCLSYDYEKTPNYEY